MVNEKDIIFKKAEYIEQIEFVDKEGFTRELLFIKNRIKPHDLIDLGKYHDKKTKISIAPNGYLLLENKDENDFVVIDIGDILRLGYNILNRETKE